MKKKILKFEIFVKIIPPHAIKSTKGYISLLVTNQLWQLSFFQPIENDF